MRYRTLAFILLVVLALPGPALAHPPAQDSTGGTVVAEGFNGPQGIALDPEGTLWVIDSGTGGEEEIQYISMETGQPAPTTMGMTARIVSVTPDRQINEVAVLPSLTASEMEHTGGARLAWLDGTLYATSGTWTDGIGDAPDLMGTLVRVDGSTVTEVADMWAYEKANNPDGLILDSHPFGITAGPDGWLWVADAAANALLRVNPASGEIQTVAAFEGLPGAFPNPNRKNAVESDPVPTAVAFDADGNAYVSLLGGFPFAPGSAKVLKVTPQGEVSDYATGFTMLTDLQRGPDGELYAVQFGMFSEQGPVPNAGSLVRVREGTASEVLVSGLSFPTALAFNAEGSAFVTINGLGAPGSGAVVRFDGLTALPGEPLAAPAQ